MRKEHNLRRLEHLKQRVLQQVKLTFGAAANGPMFTAKFEKIFAEAEADINAMEEDNHGRQGQERTQTSEARTDTDIS